MIFSDIAAVVIHNVVLQHQETLTCRHRVRRSIVTVCGISGCAVKLQQRSSVHSTCSRLAHCCSVQAACIIPA